MGAVRILLQDPASGRSVTVVGTQLSPGHDDERRGQLAVLLSPARYFSNACSLLIWAPHPMTGCIRNC